MTWVFKVVIFAEVWKLLFRKVICDACPSYTLALLLSSHHHLSAPDPGLWEHPKWFPLGRSAKFWNVTLPWPSLEVDFLATWDQSAVILYHSVTKDFSCIKTSQCLKTLVMPEYEKYQTIRMGSESCFWHREKTKCIHSFNKYLLNTYKTSGTGCLYTSLKYEGKK